MTTLAEIPRVRAGCAAKAAGRTLDAFDQERLTLGTRAADLLGYRGIVHDVTGEVHSLVKPGQLAEVLNRLDIEVLDLAAVLNYQMAEMIRATRGKIEEDNLDDWTHGYFSEAGWAHTSLRDYSAPIPEFVIDIAVRVKEALPVTEFHVQHLRDPKADPFLVAHIGKEIYFLAAWDEPRFEGRRTL